MQEWQRKLHDFNENAKATGEQAGRDAQKQLDQAWSKTEAASRKLEMAGAQGWEEAKAAYERASQDLAKAWAETNHQGK